MARGEQGSNNNMFMGGGGGDGSFVNAAQLKPHDAPSAAVMGGLNGAVIGGVGTTGVATLYNMSQQNVAKEVGLLDRAVEAFGKVLKNQMGIAIAGTAAMALLAGGLRYRAAITHNEWSKDHYAHLEKQNAAAREEARLEKASIKESGHAGTVEKEEPSTGKNTGR